MLAVALAVGAMPVVKVAAVESGQDCAVYERWGGRVVEQCRAQFPELRDRLQSMLIASNHVALSTSRGGRDVPPPDYVVNARITGLGMTAHRASGDGYCLGGTGVTAAVDWRLRDASGTVVGGGTITKTINVGSDMVAGSAQDCGTATPDGVPYDRIETGVAAALARQIAFQVAPLRVVSTDGRRIVLSYGNPLLPLGAQVSVAGRDGRPQRYRVVDATPGSVDADPVGDASPVAPGAIATIVEDDDPAANARRFRKVDLP